jgi:curved DNA-binding protein CbpA
MARKQQYSENLYDVLGVEKDASASEIKKNIVKKR